MPPRLSKRLQREQEELEALGNSNAAIDQSSHEEEEVFQSQAKGRVASSSASIGFAAVSHSSFLASSSLMAKCEADGRSSR